MVGVGGLDLFASYVGELGFGDEGLGFGADEFLFEDDDTRRVGLLVLKLGDLVHDFLLAWGSLASDSRRFVGGRRTIPARLHGRLDVPYALHGDAVLVVAVDVLVLKLANLVQQHANLVGDIRDILIAVFTPEGELLLQT